MPSLINNWNNTKIDENDYMPLIECMVITIILRSVLAKVCNINFNLTVHKYMKLVIK